MRSRRLPVIILTATLRNDGPAAWMWTWTRLSVQLANRHGGPKPSRYLIATDDRMISPDAQRAMAKREGVTVVEVKGSHAVYVSQPSAVAALIEQAARKVNAATG